jgi:hypothetical protein
VPDEGLWKRQRAVLRRAVSVGKVGACRRGSVGEVRRWERGSGGVMHPGTSSTGRERRGPRDPCEHIYIDGKLVQV